MVLMLVDHTREFFFLHRQVSDPMQIENTGPDLFWTRVLSHLCAPVFVLLAGLSVALRVQRHATDLHEVSSYVFKRGLLLVVLELTWVNFAWTFEFPPQTLYLQVIWAIGVSMMALAALIHLPKPVQYVVILFLIAGHNLLDGVSFSEGHWASVPWSVLHDRGWIPLSDGLRARTSYPVLPWIGVILLGFRMGPLFTACSALERQRVLFGSGGLALMLFVLLRAVLGYGDAPWQRDGAAWSAVMSFLNLTKYPPSFQFLLLTLGLGCIVLAALERLGLGRRLSVLGAAPLFFYVVHLYVLHLLYLAFCAVSPAADGTRASFGAVWQLWLASLALLPPLYAACQAYLRFRQHSSLRWVRYL